MGRVDARRRLFLITCLAIVPFALLAAWAHTLSPAPWEPGLVAALALGNDPWGDVVRFVNTLGDLPVWAAIVGVSALAVLLLRGARAAVLVALSLFSDLAAFAVKVVVERARPDTVATQHFFGPDSFSFPSGHVVRAVALSAALAWVLAPARVRLPAALAAGVLGWVIMGYSRVALGVHWPTDTIGGALLGISWFALTAAAVAPTGASLSLARETETGRAA